MKHKPTPEQLDNFHNTVDKIANVGIVVTVVGILFLIIKAIFI
jgi:hypothetical protein